MGCHTAPPRNAPDAGDRAGPRNVGFCPEIDRIVTSRTTWRMSWP
jgi:hypothetical protein